MTTLSQLRAFEKKVLDRGLDSKVHFFDSPEEYEEALNSGVFGQNDIAIIDDILNDEISALTYAINPKSEYK